MAFTVPIAVARTLYDTAKRLRDELGKGQEALRTAEVNIGPVPNANTHRKVLLVPDVDIILVGLRLIGEGLVAADVVELYTPQNGNNFDVAAAPGNRLMAATNGATVVDNALITPALSGLNGNVIQAGQPVIGLVQEVGSDSTPLVYFQISYILADEETTY
jgi:hypothetical protein